MQFKLFSHRASKHLCDSETRARDHTRSLLFVLGAALGLALASIVLATGAQAQNAAGPTAAPADAASASVAASAGTYSAAQVEQAFRFIDSNRDQQLSREEAAGFRGVARHFDEADLDKNGLLSREEFERALLGDRKR